VNRQKGREVRRERKEGQAAVDSFMTNGKGKGWIEIQEIEENTVQGMVEKIERKLGWGRRRMGKLSIAVSEGMSCCCEVR